MSLTRYQQKADQFKYMNWFLVQDICKRPVKKRTIEEIEARIVKRKMDRLILKSCWGLPVRRSDYPLYMGGGEPYWI